MFVYVQALDYGKLLKIEVEANDLVSDLKAKIDQELGDEQAEDAAESIFYLGVALEANAQLSAYNVRDSSLLYLANNLQSQQQYQLPLSQPAQPLSNYNQYQNYQYQAPNYPVRW